SIPVHLAAGSRRTSGRGSRLPAGSWRAGQAGRLRAPGESGRPGEEEIGRRAVRSVAMHGTLEERMVGLEGAALDLAVDLGGDLLDHALQAAGEGHDAVGDRFGQVDRALDA